MHGQLVFSGAFKLQKNLLIFKPTCHHADENYMGTSGEIFKRKK